MAKRGFPFRPFWPKLLRFKVIDHFCHSGGVFGQVWACWEGQGQLISTFTYPTSRIPPTLPSRRGHRSCRARGTSPWPPPPGVVSINIVIMVILSSPDSPPSSPASDSASGSASRGLSWTRRHSGASLMYVSEQSIWISWPTCSSPAWSPAASWSCPP